MKSDREVFEGLPLLLTPAQVREVTGLSRSAIEGLVESRRLEFVVIGKRWRRYTKESVRRVCFGDRGEDQG